MNHPAPIVRRPASYQDVLDAPPHLVAEIAHGALHLSPRPASRHARASFGLAGHLEGPFGRGVGGPGGWWFAFEPELHLGDAVLVPDLAGWRRERMAEYPDAPFFTLAPDWLCEILSPSTREFDRGEKRALYGERGVDWLWMIDAEVRTLEVFRRRPEGWLLVETFHGDQEVAAPPFDAVPFPFAALRP